MDVYMRGVIMQAYSNVFQLGDAILPRSAFSLVPPDVTRKCACFMLVYR
jgi:hypothetical protein